MPSHWNMIRAIFKRNFLAYFINPTGYVFITVFILLGAIAAFWQTAFFMNNLANLDQLTNYFPILLLFFVPALTMNVWSEERRQGTDELLFTLPGRDTDIVLGKYLAVLGIYSVAVLFSLSHLVILAWLGKPDFGLMFATYLGYWLAGGALLAVGMVASSLTSNATVAFIVGAGMCATFVFINNVQTLFGTKGSEFIRNVGIIEHFIAFSAGVVPLSGVLYFVSLAVVMLYVNVAIVGRRHIKGSQGASLRVSHFAVRATCLAVALVCLCVLVGRTGASLDATAERLHTLQQPTLDLLGQIPEDRPVYVQAFFSPVVPESLVETRKNLLNVLRRIDAVAGSRVQVVIQDCEPFTETAEHAAKDYGILARRTVNVGASGQLATDVFLGLVFTSGPDEIVIPFFDRGLPVEYELARSIRVVSQSARKKLGILVTDANLFGGFDFQSGVSRPDWSIVSELRKQYEVQQVPMNGPYPEDLDALLAVLPSTLPQSAMDMLQSAIAGGLPTLIMDDPLPIFQATLAPSQPRDATRNPFTARNMPPLEPKGDVRLLMGSLGLEWPSGSVVWSGVNPHPNIANAPPEIVFITETTDNPRPFNQESVISSGLQEVVLVYPGYVRASAIADPSVQFTPLLRCGSSSGELRFDELVQRGFMSMQIRPNVRRVPTPDSYIHAIQIRGKSAQGAEMSRLLNVIFIADADMISETFFDLRRQGFQGFSFDNITFVLNCIDVLAGDESFVSVRKHRPKHRTLTRVEALNQVFVENLRTEEEQAEQQANDELAAAQARLTEKVNQIRQREDIDDQAKTILLRNLQEVESRRLSVIEGNIKLKKEHTIAEARVEKEQSVAGIQRAIKWWAAVVPPIPTLMLAMLFFAHRQRRERRTIETIESEP